MHGSSRHQGRPEDQAIVATVECNQADVGCLKDGPVTYINTLTKPLIPRCIIQEYHPKNIYLWIIPKKYPYEYSPRCQDDTRYKMIQDDTVQALMFVHFQVFRF